jgi:hypothetical protein
MIEQPGIVIFTPGRPDACQGPNIGGADFPVKRDWSSLSSVRGIRPRHQKMNWRAPFQALKEIFYSALTGFGLSLLWFLAD